jgi:hypothetical protein
VNYISRYSEKALIFEVSYWEGLDNLWSKVAQILAQLDELIHNISPELGGYISSPLEGFASPHKPIFALYVGSGWKSRWATSILDEAVLFPDLGP